MEFEDWLLSQGLSASTVAKYAGAIDGSLTEWSAPPSSIGKPIRAIHDIGEFAALSELIEGTSIFIERNARGNHMYGAALNNYAKYLVARSASELSNPAPSLTEELGIFEGLASDIPQFKPQGQEDGRERILRQVVRRQGQPQFRRKLMKAYDSRCAITGCSVWVVLEAAHITPYLGPATNHVSNGFLLRADMHTLWDLGLIAVDPSKMQLVVSSVVEDVAYQALSGTPIYQPSKVNERPSRAALKYQWDIFHK